IVQAATITACTFDKDTYHQGETGFISTIIYNDKDREIRVTELTATINYYYSDGNVYLQKFFADTTLPVEIQQGQSSTFSIPFSLPTNVAIGYTSVEVKARTQLWNSHLERWIESDHPTHQPVLYVESPFKQQSETQMLVILLLGTASVALAGVTLVLFVLNRRARSIGQPIA
ncbi:MAG: hypothetical protein JSV85_00040, partial [Candidatus Bathyarchaeota archaeon]